MDNKGKVLVIDIDGTICKDKKKDQSYSDLEPRMDVIQKIQEYRKDGYYIIFYTSRNMNTHDFNLGRINAKTAPIIIEWLNRYDIPYDEIYYGKPWCGFEGFYIDDKTIRPSEFINNSKEEIDALLNKEKDLH